MSIQKKQMSLSPIRPRMTSAWSGITGSLHPRRRAAASCLTREVRIAEENLVRDLFQGRKAERTHREPVHGPKPPLRIERQKLVPRLEPRQTPTLITNLRGVLQPHQTTLGMTRGHWLRSKGPGHQEVVTACEVADKAGDTVRPSYRYRYLAGANLAGINQSIYLFSVLSPSTRLHTNQTASRSRFQRVPPLAVEPQTTSK